ncbi:hypothetical protein TeGR_g530 [Tetraparma gracilis]|uniref:Cytochrome b5 heme-binding domain-containing protein n=1 Tax=Tetraparma gracilis TaxID=2962635 RepID=A0ABQ6N3N3_9STRA|nr:hypothetical protein TeGR_g530 [Tetraparma gracilis]
MPPNSEVTNRRSRRLQEQDAASAPASTKKLKKIRLAELSQHEVCIDGLVYDIREFGKVHPGGDQVLLFGGNDVTAQYKMIHHGHSSNPQHYLSKMALVGEVTDFSCEYKFDTPFEQEIKREVFKIVKRGREFGTPGYLLRAAFYVGLMAFAQLTWVASGSSPLRAVLLGCAGALIGLNVQHDANHGAASKRPWVNEVLGYGADMIGGSKYNWIQQHWTHHAYQAFFFLPLLSFYWLSSVFNTQVLDLNQRGSAQIMDWSNDYTKRRIPVSLLLRALYIGMNIVNPFFHHSPATALYHIWIMSTVESLFLSGLFSLSHNFEGADRYPVDHFEKTGEQVCWMKAQVSPSASEAAYQDLFPRMSSAYYPYIAPTVRRICEKHGVRYAWYPWIHQNFIATVTYMHNSGTGGHWELDPLSGK